MPVNIKYIKKIVIIFSILVGTSALFTIASTVIYFEHYSPIKSEEGDIVCSNKAETGYAESTVKDAVLGHGVDNNAKIKLSGKISYSATAGSFYLRDGAFILPLDLSTCADADVYKMNRETLIFTGGVISRANSGATLRVDGIRNNMPVWMQIMFNAGIYGWIGAFFGAIILLFRGSSRLINWLLTAIGLRHQKSESEIPAEAKDNRDAGSSVLAGIFAPLLWGANPIIGAIWLGFGIYSGWKGMQSEKKKIALIGLILCSAELIILPIISIFFGWFSAAPEPNLVKNIFIDNF